MRIQCVATRPFLLPSKDLDTRLVPCMSILQAHSTCMYYVPAECVNAREVGGGGEGGRRERIL